MAEKFRNKYRVPSARLKNWNYGANGVYFITICTKEMQHLFGKVVDKKMILNSVGKLAEEFWIEIVNQFPYVELGNFQIMPNHMHGILIIDKSVVAPVETRFIASKFDDIDSGEKQFIASKLDDIDSGETRFIASKLDDIDSGETRLIASKLDDIDSGETRFIASKLDDIDSGEKQFIASKLDDIDSGETRLIASVQQCESKLREIGGFAGENNPMLADNISRIIRWYKGRCAFEIRKINPSFAWHVRFHDHIIRNSESFERIQNYIEDNPSMWEEDKFYR